MKKTLFLTAILGAAFAAPAMASGTQSGFVAYNSQWSGIVGPNGSSSEQSGLPMLFVSNDKNRGTLSTDDALFAVVADSNGGVTAEITSLTSSADGARVLISSSQWDNYDRYFSDLTIDEATVKNASLEVYNPTNGGGTQNATIKKVTGTLTDIKNYGTLAIGTAGETPTTTTITAISHAGNLTINGTAAISGAVTIADSAAMTVNGDVTGTGALTFKKGSLLVTGDLEAESLESTNWASGMATSSLTVDGDAKIGTITMNQSTGSTANGLTTLIKGDLTTANTLNVGEMNLFTVQGTTTITGAGINVGWMGYFDLADLNIEGGIAFENATQGTTTINGTIAVTVADSALSETSVDIVTDTVSNPDDNGNGFLTANITTTKSYQFITVTGDDTASNHTIGGTHTFTLNDVDALMNSDGLVYQTTGTVTGTKDSTIYAVKKGTVAIGDISGQTGIQVARDATLNVNATDADLTTVTGTGTVEINANTSLTDSKMTSATGTLKLTSNTLTVGSGDSQTNSISSFGTVEFAGGTLYYQNKQDTIHNVTVANGATGIINSNDMGAPAANAKLLLADTTTVDGTLTMQSTWNAQFEIAKLTGAGTLAIEGSNGGSSSTQEAAYTLDDISGFTGSITFGNSKATVTIVGNNTISGKIASGAVAQSGDGTLTLTGELVGVGLSSGSITLNGAYGYLTTGTSTMGANITLGANGFTANNGNGSDKHTFSGSISGTGDFIRSDKGSEQTFTFTGDVSGWTGDFKATNTNGFTTNVAFSGSASTVKADITKSGTNTLNLTAGADNDQTFSGTVTVDKLTVSEGKTVAMTGDLTASTLVLESGASLSLKAADTTISNITLNAGTVTLGHEDTTLTTSALNLTGESTINSNVKLTSGATVTVASGASLALGCTLTLDGDVTIKLADEVTDDTDSFQTIVTGIDTFDASDWTLSNGTTDTWYKYMTESTDGSTYNYTTAGSATNRALVYNSTSGNLMVTPEPATATLSLLALAGLAARRRRH